MRNLNQFQRIRVLSLFIRGGSIHIAVARLCYNQRVRHVLFTADAVRQFKKLPKAVRPFIKETISTQLLEGDPTATTHNRFRLRRASPFADYELRAGEWRIFYRVLDNDVIITLLDEKRGNVLIVEGEGLRI